jgi:hypothetical protein
MKYIKSKGHTNCITCQNWGGQRKPTSDRNHVECGDQHDKGECIGGLYNRQQKGADNTCGQWTKWTVLG